MRRIAVALARSTAVPGRQLCSVCVDVVGVSGAAISVMGGDHAGVMCSSDNGVRALEEIQFSSGAGPCHDAYVTRTPVSSDRMDGVATLRWPFFTELAATLGVGAAFAYPLQSGGATVGVMGLYQRQAGALTERQHDDTLLLAEVIGATVLTLQADDDDALQPPLGGSVTYRAQIHQASGMVSVQLGIPAAEAMSRIRAYAFAHDVTVETVAAEIVARRLRLADDSSADPDAVDDSQEGGRA